MTIEEFPSVWDKEYAGIIENMEPHKCDELEFYSLNALPKKTAGFIRHAIECMRQGQCYSEFVWENRECFHTTKYINKVKL